MSLCARIMPLAYGIFLSVNDSGWSMEKWFIWSCFPLFEREITLESELWVYLTRNNLKNVIDMFCIKFAFDVVRRAYVARSIGFVARKARIVWIWQWPRDILEEKKKCNQQIRIVSCVRYLDWLRSPFDILIQRSSVRTATEKHTILLSVNRVPLFFDYIIISYFVVAHLAVEKLSRQISNISVGAKIGIELWIYLPRWAS